MQADTVNEAAVRPGVVYSPRLSHHLKRICSSSTSYTHKKQPLNRSSWLYLQIYTFCGLQSRSPKDELPKGTIPCVAIAEVGGNQVGALVVLRYLASACLGKR